ncbi:MAG: hypothetical protein ABJA78_12425 [Ferruginibacter sp.]
MSFLKILHWTGIAACILLIVSCFLPWTHYANDPVIRDEAQRTFTGFYSYDNYYGRPGKFLSAIAIISMLMKLLPKVWAKRTDLFVTGIGIAYTARTVVEYTGSYTGIHPEIKIGLILMLVSVITIFIAALSPDINLIEKKN